LKILKSRRSHSNTAVSPPVANPLYSPTKTVYMQSHVDTNKSEEDGDQDDLDFARPSMIRYTTSSNSRRTRVSAASSSSGYGKQLKAVFVKKIKVFMYNYGSPKVGNYGFKLLYDRIVPNTFRVVVDGDLVVGLPPSGYDHVGTEIMIDNLGSGSIIIDPSFVEKWLRTQMKSKVSAHALLCYGKGLLGLKLAAEYMKQFAEQSARGGQSSNPLRLAVQLRNEHKIERLVELHHGRNSFTSPTSKSDIEEQKHVTEIPLQTISTGKKPVLQSTAESSVPSFSQTIDGHGDTQKEVHVTEEEQQDQVHYDHDVRNMNELLSQMNTFGPALGLSSVEGWIKKNTIQRFQGKKDSTTPPHPET
jgi:hypothetical protein